MTTATAKQATTANFNGRKLIYKQAQDFRTESGVVEKHTWTMLCRVVKENAFNAEFVVEEVLETTGNPKATITAGGFSKNPNVLAFMIKTGTITFLQQ